LIPRAIKLIKAYLFIILKNPILAQQISHNACRGKRNALGKRIGQEMK